MKKDIIRRLIQVFFVQVVQGAILFIAAGTLD